MSTKCGEIARDKTVHVHDEVQVQVQAITQFFNVATSLAGETI